MRMALLNFAVAAMAGAFLRYKVSFSLPFVDFKNLLHAHSHFAFAAWISMALFALLAGQFLPKEQLEKKSLRTLFLLSQVTSYGMLVSFLLEEYGAVSIAFSTAYIFVTYAFAVVLWRGTKHMKQQLSVLSLRASLIFLAVSSLGPYGLAIIKATHFISGPLYHNAIYWYLHFQYNGWFSFAIFALFLRMREQQGIATTVFRLPLQLMLWSCVPVYLLSILWIVPPLWVYLIAGTAGMVQLVALVMLFIIFRKEHKRGEKRSVPQWLFLFVFISFSIKLLLQALSVFPVLNQFVFGHRPVIIGYLHLVMLGFASFFLIGTAFVQRYTQLSRPLARTGLWIFVAGVLLNEAALMAQGFAGILFLSVRWAPAVLFAAALLLFSGTTLLAFSQRKRGLAQAEASTSIPIQS